MTMTFSSFENKIDLPWNISNKIIRSDNNTDGHFSSGHFVYTGICIYIAYPNSVKYSIDLSGIKIRNSREKERVG